MTGTIPTLSKDKIMLYLIMFALLVKYWERPPLVGKSEFDSSSQTKRIGIHSFPAWRSTFEGIVWKQAGKFACCVLGQGT